MPLKISATIGSKTYPFLVDTGSSVSILPNYPEFSPKLRSTGISLSTASGSSMKTYGEIDIDLGIRRLRRSFPWSFVVADVTQPILGVDFLAKHCLLVDCKNKIYNRCLN